MLAVGVLPRLARTHLRRYRPIEITLQTGDLPTSSEVNRWVGEALRPVSFKNTCDFLINFNYNGDLPLIKFLC